MWNFSYIPPDLFHSFIYPNEIRWPNKFFWWDREIHEVSNSRSIMVIVVTITLDKQPSQNHLNSLIILCRKEACLSLFLWTSFSFVHTSVWLNFSSDVRFNWIDFAYVTNDRLDRIQTRIRDVCFFFFFLISVRLESIMDFRLETHAFLDRLVCVLLFSPTNTKEPFSLPFSGS